MRRALVILAVVSFAILALVDLSEGHVQLGVASLCLAVANGLLLSS